MVDFGGTSGSGTWGEGDTTSLGWPRNFARAFGTETGMTPAKFVEERASRRHAARWALPVEAIAERCGFGDPERMRRSFRRMLRVSPQDYRARFKSTVLHCMSTCGGRCCHRLFELRHLVVNLSG